MRFVGPRLVSFLLVAPLFQANRGPFVATLKQPAAGRVEIPVSWSPVLVELLP